MLAQALTGREIEVFGDEVHVFCPDAESAGREAREALLLVAMGSPQDLKSRMPRAEILFVNALLLFFYAALMVTLAVRHMKMKLE